MADDVFKFQNPPFSAEGSGKFLYLDAPRRRILADLIAHICDGEGPILLVAEPGMGKTMLLDRLAEEAGAHNIRIVFSLGSAASRQCGRSRIAADGVHSGQRQRASSRRLARPRVPASLLVNASRRGSRPHRAATGTDRNRAHARSARLAVCRPVGTAKRAA